MLVKSEDPSQSLSDGFARLRSRRKTSKKKKNKKKSSAMGKTKSKSVYTEEMKLLHKILLLLHISSPEVKCTLNMSYRNRRKGKRG